MMIGARTAAWAKSGYTARDYVQDGLVAMWDGIENVGWGVHDPNATTWVDLKSARVVNFGNIARFTDDALLKTKSGSVETLFGINPAQYEVVIRDRGSEGWIIPCSSSDGFYPSFRYSSRNIFYGKNFIGKIGVAKDEMSLSCSIDGLYVNAELMANDYNDYWGTNGNNVFFASSKGHSTQNIINYEICSLRFYDRILTQSELAANYAIDKVRFNIPDAA